MNEAASDCPIERFIFRLAPFPNSLKHTSPKCFGMLRTKKWQMTVQTFLIRWKDFNAFPWRGRSTDRRYISFCTVSKLGESCCIIWLFLSYADACSDLLNTYHCETLGMISFFNVLKFMITECLLNFRFIRLTSRHSKTISCTSHDLPFHKSFWNF